MCSLRCLLFHDSFLITQDLHYTFGGDKLVEPGEGGENRLSQNRRTPLSNLVEWNPQKRGD